MITKNKFVTVSYEMRSEQDGAVLEAARVDQPMGFICGQGQTMEYFEMNLLDKKEGDAFEFKIPMANAYGERNEEMVVDLPKDIFKDIDADDLIIGNTLPMMDSMGRRLQGCIVAIVEEEVKIDFNHPMAGKDLFFKGDVLGVRDATDEELEALNSKCGGGCGGCSSDGDCGSSGCGSHGDGGCGSDDGGCGCSH